MNNKISGFVLSISDYKENDSLLQVMSKEYGLLSLVGKSSKKLDSKNHFLVMCVYEFIIDYKENKTIYSIHGSKVLHNYFRNDDIELLSISNIFLEAALKNRDINSYEELLFVFENINSSNQFLLGSLFFCFLANKFGVMPYVDGCVHCQSSKVVSISNSDGGFVCQKHLNSERVLNVNRLRKFRLLVKGGMQNYQTLLDYSYDVYDFYLFVNFYIQNTDLKLNSYELYRNIN